jgi:predicted regulator of Ras-like GTPase activity (Roadblock/LC7/MglB family)
MISALTVETSRQISEILAELLDQVEAEAVYFCDRGGNIVAYQQATEYEHKENIAALAAGSFFATLEMARLVGESEFQYIIHQGEKMSIYMEVTTYEMLLLVIFSKDSNPGLVKLYSKHTCEKLGQFNITIKPGEQNPILFGLHLEMNDQAQPFTKKA